jgi:hypothetical protein
LKPICHGVPPGSILGPLFFLVYINDLPNVISDMSKPVLYADDTSIIISDKDSLNFKRKIHTVFDVINNWFQTNLLSLNFDNTNFVQSLTKNCHELDLQVSYEDKQIASIHNIKFWGINMDRSLFWKNHTDQLINKLNKSYVIRSIKPFLSLKAIKMVYFSYVHSLLIYGIIFWWNSFYAKSVFKIQTRIIRIVINSGSRDSCRDLFKVLNILPLQSQYIYSTSVFVVMNKGLLKSNSDVHNIQRRKQFDLRMPSSKLTLFQKGAIFGEYDF